MKGKQNDTCLACSCPCAEHTVHTHGHDEHEHEHHVHAAEGACLACAGVSGAKHTCG